MAPRNPYCTGHGKRKRHPATRRHRSRALPLRRAILQRMRGDKGCAAGAGEPRRPEAVSRARHLPSTRERTVPINALPRLSGSCFDADSSQSHQRSQFHPGPYSDLHSGSCPGPPGVARRFPGSGLAFKGKNHDDIQCWRQAPTSRGHRHRRGARTANQVGWARHGHRGRKRWKVWKRHPDRSWRWPDDLLRPRQQGAGARRRPRQ